MGFMLGPAAQRGGPDRRRDRRPPAPAHRRSGRGRSTLARRLEGLNVERQALDQRILDEALAQVEQAADPERDAGLRAGGRRLASRAWSGSSRRAWSSDTAGPAFLIAFDGDIGKGSGRSISRFDLHAALLACGDLLERYGGHHMAAGLTIRRDRLDEFRERFGGIAREVLGPDDLGPEQRVDLELGLREATRELERLCRHLEPCGAGQREPGVRRARACGSPAGRGSATGHLKGVLDDGTDAAPRHRLPVGRPGALAGRRAGGRGVPARVPTSGTGTRRCRRGCARCRRTRRDGHAIRRSRHAGCTRTASDAIGLRSAPLRSCSRWPPACASSPASSAAGGSSMPKDARVRPTADRVREAWMSILGADAAGRPGARSLRRQRRARPRGALPGRRVGHLRRAQPAVAPALEANIDALGVADRVHGAPGRRAPLRRAARGRRLRRRARRPAVHRRRRRPAGGALPPDPVRAHSFRRAPRRRSRLDGDETRRYGDTALTFCHAP